MAVEQYISVPMLYVNVIKGDRKPNEKGQILHDFEGEKMFCYVCALNTKQVIAIFVKPEAIEKPGLLEAIQKLRNENPTVIPFVVCLSGPNSELENKLGSLYEEKNLDFGLTVLPKKEAIAEIYQSFTFIKPEANITMVIYKGKKVEDIIDEEEFLIPYYLPQHE